MLASMISENHCPAINPDMWFTATKWNTAMEESHIPCALFTSLQEVQKFFFLFCAKIKNFKFILADSQMELQIMYAGTKLALQKEADLTRVYEVRELDELTEEWLQEKLGK